MKKLDLHMHSYFSDDGEFSPEVIIDKAIENGLNLISITDHNSVKANYVALEYINGKNISYIPGIEIDCQYNGLNLHLLGYNFDFTKSCFADLEENIIKEEQKAGIKRIEKIKEATNLYLDAEDVLNKATNGIIPGELIAEVLLEDERNKDSEILNPYRAGGKKSDMPYVNFYWDYFSQGKPAYVHIEYISLSEAIKMIKDNGGIAIIAHPGNNLKNNLNIINDLIAEGIDGIEVFSSYHSKETIDFFYNKAIKNKLLITCGTDFHGKNKPNIELGEFEYEIGNYLCKNPDLIFGN
ncbi:MAG: PHP domain-containing protein [Clostridium sp.]|uniref:PHP domain-containing protein n=1 Tax=Clostridium sp. TaxID=1506 RepID=UPI00290C2EB0|nr:PHP domain-containing protein [Clostridium sp.]MDU5110234.1 PHP domain-containing protein [Clostridium sp.]